MEEPIPPRLVPTVVRPVVTPLVTPNRLIIVPIFKPVYYWILYLIYFTLFFLGCYGGSGSTSACPNQCPLGTYSTGGAGALSTCVGVNPGMKYGQLKDDRSHLIIELGCYGGAAMTSACPNVCPAGQWSGGSYSSCPYINAGMMTIF